MADGGVQVVQSALDGMRNRPADLSRALAFYSDNHGHDADLEWFLECIGVADPNNPVMVLVEAALQHWDFLQSPDWAAGTERNTHERRTRVYELLGLSDEARSLCDQRIPVWIATDPPIVIAEEHLPWYSPDSPAYEYYFSRYRKHLASSGWPATSVETLAQVTGSVVERISDPSRTEQYQSKGLVVGYVQSG